MTFPRMARQNEDCPKYLRLARDFERQMRAGALRIGDRLPSVRQLKSDHRVSLSTAVECYLWLERQGYIHARPKSGFYVKRTPMADTPAADVALPALRPVKVQHVGGLTAGCEANRSRPDVVDLGPAIVGSALLPLKALNKSIRMALRVFGDHAVRYEDPTGSLRLRRQIARLMFRQGTSCSPEDIIITSGQTEALNLAIRAVARPGDIFAVESPGCYDVLQALESLQMRALEIPHVLGNGVDLEALQTASPSHRIVAVITNAACHNPLGDCMSEEAKARLVEFAAATGVAIIECDTFGDLVFSGDRPTMLKAFDTDGTVLQCSSLAHYVAPGFNLGWISGGRWHASVSRLKSITNYANASLTQLALAEFLESGGLERHLKQLRVSLFRSINAARAEVLRTFPEGTRVNTPEGGFVLWIHLPSEYDGLEIAQRAGTIGINILPGEIFSPNRRFQDCIRIACGHAIDVLKPAIHKLAGILQKSG
jgi:DNA-binding transcriptional MocR family regulator